MKKIVSMQAGKRNARKLRKDKTFRRKNDGKYLLQKNYKPWIH